MHILYNDYKKSQYRYQRKMPIQIIFKCAQKKDTMAAVRPNPMELEEESDVDEFELSSEDEGNHGKITVPVSHIQGRGGKDEQAGRFIPSGNLVNLSEDGQLGFIILLEIQSILANPAAKEELIRRLLEVNPQDKPAKRPPGSITMKAEPKDVEYEGKHDPTNPENETDFKKAYAKLISKIASQAKNEPQMLVTQEELNKIEEDKLKAEDAKNFPERIHSHTEKVKKKKDLVKEELEEKEMKECTFAPKTLRKTEKRRLEDFLNDQKRYLEKRQENINKMAQDNKVKEEQSIVSLPRINERSKVLTEVKKEQTSQPVHERLFAKSKKPITAPEEDTKPEEKKVRKKEGAPREFTLYEEAKKRQERWLERQRKEAEGLKASKPSKEYSKDPYVQQKFTKAFNAVLNSFGNLVPDQLLTYDQTSIALQSQLQNRGNTNQNVLCEAAATC
eukprot:TRINITY_DN4226_c0_g1_i3.p4 TRINITY_DN4226_c0_g1~~TRINITY_DN4226_c0_g1_i3.p4  ORF type:complete len:447 (+),score=84.11 TRINITY_DN4226_c0_g1_i3:10566-11906(+)